MRDSGVRIAALADKVEPPVATTLVRALLDSMAPETLEPLFTALNEARLAVCGCDVCEEKARRAKRCRCRAESSDDSEPNATQVACTALEDALAAQYRAAAAAAAQ